MKYRSLYKLLEHRQNHNPGFRYTDYSTGNSIPHTAAQPIRPLWIIAEDKSTGHRIWITQLRRELTLTYAKMDSAGRNPGLACTIRCNTQHQLVAEIKHLFGELDATAA